MNRTRENYIVGRPVTRESIREMTINVLEMVHGRDRTEEELRGLDCDLEKRFEAGGFKGIE
jgi:hypothetical protein